MRYLRKVKLHWKLTRAGSDEQVSRIQDHRAGGQESSVVLAVGATARRAAQHLHELRGYRAVWVDAVADVPNLLRQGDWKVVIVILDAASEPARSYLAVAAAAAETDENLTLGFLLGRGEAELLAHAMRFSPRPLPGDRSKRIVVSAMPEFSAYVHGSSITNACDFTDQDDRDELLLGDNELLLVLAHSNGHDHGAAGACLCRQPAAEELRAVENTFPCYRGATCKFSSKGMRVLNSDTIQSKRVVLLSCWAVRIGNYPFGFESTVAYSLIHRAGVEALVAPVRVFALTPEDYSMAYHLCNAGYALGAVANRMNRLRRHRHERVELLCFGDPESRLLGRTRDVFARVMSDERLVEFQPGSDGSRDIRLRLAETDIPAEPIVLVNRKSTCSRAVCFPDGNIYITLPTGATVGKSSFRLVSRQELREQLACSTLPQDLLADLAVLRLRIDAIRQNWAIKGKQPLPSVDVAEGQLRLLQDLVRRWPIYSTPAGSVLSTVFIDALWASLHQQLVEVANSFIEMYQDNIRAFGDVRTTEAADRYYALIGTQTLEEPCEHCGQAVDEATWEAVELTQQRKYQRCQACGFVLEGDPTIGRSLTTDGTIRPGSAFRTNLEVTNPYSFAAAAHSCVILRPFSDPGENIAASAATSKMTTGESGRLTHELHVPAAWQTGVYYLFGIILAGGRLNLLRRAIVVSSGTESPGPQ